MIKKIVATILIFIPIIIMGAKNEDGSKVNRAKTIEIDIEDKTTEEDTTDKQLETLELMQLAETMVKNDDKDEEADSKYKRKEKTHTANRGTFRIVPKTNTSMKSYMSYKTITDKTSEQYKLQHYKNVYTDSEGFRRIGDNFIVAIGTYFNCNVGQEVVVRLSSGSTFKAIVGDIKANIHTDGDMHVQHNVDGSVIEFLVDSRKLDGTIRKMGDCSYSSANDFKGDVVGITVYENN